jgi:fused signal recognition particle receptor
MGFLSRFIATVRGTSTASALDWAELERELLASDLGPALVAQLLETAKKERGDDAVAAITKILQEQLSSKSRELSHSSGTSVLLVVGVNGTGKTTSVAKLATHLTSRGEKVVLGAADTFRAAAVDQLKTWGERLQIPVISGKESGDPAAVAFDAAKNGAELGVHRVLIDTAGRLHTKGDLMDELGKVKRVVEKVAPVTEVLLVIDATTGQNGLAQAKIFSEAVAVTGLILTKLDGSARGGIALAVERELDIPIKFIGTGEAAADFAPFDPARYIAGLLA